MPYIVIRSWFPSYKASEVAKTYIEERKKYPRDRTLGKIVAEAVRSEEDGIMSMGIMEVKEGKLEEALNRRQNIEVLYHDIEGYKYKLSVWWTAVEALAMIGMKAPE